MRISNEQDESQKDSAFSRLIQLQGDFQARLVEETMRYLQRLRGPLSPTAPGTVVRAGGETELHVEGMVGTSVSLSIELENRQRAFTMVMPQISALLAEDGTAWFPEARTSAVGSPGGSCLVAPRETAEIEVSLTLPPELPPGLYRGALILLGFRNSSVPVSVLAQAPVAGSDKAAPPAPKKADARAKAAKKTSAKPTSKKGDSRK